MNFSTTVYELFNFKLFVGINLGDTDKMLLLLSVLTTDSIVFVGSFFLCAHDN